MNDKNLIDYDEVMKAMHPQEGGLEVAARAATVLPLDPEQAVVGNIVGFEGIERSVAEETVVEVSPEPESEWAVVTCMIHALEAIPGADAVELAKIGPEDGATWDYPVVVRKGDYEVNDLAVYIPVDSVMPDEPEFAFLGSDRRRLRAKKIRGVYSEGLLLKAEDAADLMARRAAAIDSQLGDGGPFFRRIALQALYELGTSNDISGGLGITRYVEQRRVPGPLQRSFGPKPPPDNRFAPVFSVHNAKKGLPLADDTYVIITEKLHGSSIRFGKDRDGNIRIGTHKRWLDGEYGNGALLSGLRELGLEPICYAMEPGEFFYGEIIGPGIQDLKYGSKVTFRVFAFVEPSATKTGFADWSSWSLLNEQARKHGLDVVPALASGPLGDLKAGLKTLAEGETTMSGANHVREGIVIRTARGTSGREPEMWKLVGEGYRLRKNATDFVEE